MLREIIINMIALLGALLGFGLLYLYLIIEKIKSEKEKTSKFKKLSENQIKLIDIKLRNQYLDNKK